MNTLKKSIAAGFFALTATSMTSQAQQPNIIVILTDDMCYNAISYTGGPVATPNLDSLCTEGTFSPQGYSTHAVCAPARAGLMTGRFQARFGYETLTDTNEIANKYDYGVDTNEIMLPQVLKEVGYKTSFFGKWHLGGNDKYAPFNRGFDYTLGFEGRCSYFRLSSGKYPLLKNGEPVKGLADDVYLGDYLAENASKFIHENKDTPFFMYFADYAMHGPFQAPKADIPKGKHSYHGLVKAFDRTVGTLLTALDESGQRDNTLIFFMSDNGGITKEEIIEAGFNNGPLRGGKARYTEGGIRVPYAISWPAQFGGKGDFDYPISSLDIFPTSVAAAGGKLPNDREYDGINLLPYLKGEKTGLEKRTLMWRAIDGHAIRKGDHKLVWVRDKITTRKLDLKEGINPKKRPENYKILPPRYQHRKQDGYYFPAELYNLSKDVGETNNIAEQNPEIVKELVKELDRFDNLSSQPQYQLNK